MLKVNPMNFNHLKQNCHNFWNDQIQKARSQRVILKGPEVRVPVLHQKLLVYKLLTRVSTMQSQETRTVVESPPGERSDQCSHESKSDYKQFDEHWTSKIGAAVADVKRRTQSLTDCIFFGLRNLVGRNHSTQKSRRRNSACLSLCFVRFCNGLKWC